MEGGNIALGRGIAKAPKDQPEIETMLIRMNEGNMQLESIHSRLSAIRDNLYGTRPAEVVKVDANKPASGNVAAMREQLERGQWLRNSINELLAEIEAFI